MPRPGRQRICTLHRRVFGLAGAWIGDGRRDRQPAGGLSLDDDAASRVGIANRQVHAVQACDRRDQGQARPGP
jgi:hypothetical protein